MRATAELATVAATETSTGRAWDDVATKLTGMTWTDANDNDFAIVKRAFVAQGTPARNDVDAKPGFTITLKGARTMVLETEISLFNPGDIDPGLLDLFIAAVPNQPVRCDSDEGATLFERWYRVMPAGSKPLFAHVASTSGSAGTTETLTFVPNAQLPVLGDEAINGTWTDTCSR